MNKISICFTLVFTILSLKIMYGQHDYWLSLTLPNDWIATNDIRGMIIEWRGGKRNGRLKKKGKTALQYNLDEDGILRKSRIIKIERTTQTEIFWYEVGSKKNIDTFWTKKEFYPDGKLKRIVADAHSWTKLYYDGQDRIDYEIARNQTWTDSTKYYYADGKLLSMKAFKLSYLKESEARWKATFIYNKNNQLTAVKQFKRDNQGEWSYYRSLQYSYQDDGLPSKTDYITIYRGREFLEVEERYIYY